MLKPFPPFVASLHVTVRIEPADRAVDHSAAIGKLTDGIRLAAAEAIGDADWRSFHVGVDKVPPPPAACEKARLDPDLVSLIVKDPVKRLVMAINREIAHQHRKQSGLILPNIAQSGHQFDESAWVTVEGTLDVESLAKAIHEMTKR